MLAQIRVGEAGLEFFGGLVVLEAERLEEILIDHVRAGRHDRVDHVVFDHVDDDFLQA